MKNTNESVIQFGHVLGMSNEDIESVLSDGYHNMRKDKNTVENIRLTLPAHNLRDICLGAALYAGMLDNTGSEITAMVAKANQ